MRCRASEIEDSEYSEFYKSFSRDTEDPLAKIHFTAEGEVTFKSILFVPKTSPVDWQNQGNAKVWCWALLYALRFGIYI